MSVAVPPSFAPLLEGIGVARRARRLASARSLLEHFGTGPRRAAELRRTAYQDFLATNALRQRARGPQPRPGVPDVLSILGLEASGEAHAAMMVWALDRDGEHGLGEGFGDALRRALGLPPTVLPKRVWREGATTYLADVKGVVALSLTPPKRVVLPARRTLRSVGSIRVVGPSAPPTPPPLVAPRHLGREDLVQRRTIEPSMLLDVLAAVTPDARREGAMLLAAWARTIARSVPGRMTMADGTEYSPDVRYLLEHWQEYLDVLAVREQVDKEFVQVRYRILAAVREKYRETDGWSATVDEDWILLRRTDWPIPAEEWLAFVVVLTDVESVMTEGREGWWSAVSLPTDGDFDGETFTTLVRARLDPTAWRPHLAQRWPGHALSRNLPRIDARGVLSGEIERTALDELARYVQLVPGIDQALRDMG